MCLVDDTFGRHQVPHPVGCFKFAAILKASIIHWTRCSQPSEPPKPCFACLCHVASWIFHEVGIHAARVHVPSNVKRAYVKKRKKKKKLIKQNVRRTRENQLPHPERALMGCADERTLMGCFVRTSPQCPRARFSVRRVSYFPMYTYNAPFTMAH